MRLHQPMLIVNGDNVTTFRPYLTEEEAEEFWNVNRKHIIAVVDSRFGENTDAESGISSVDCGHTSYSDDCRICYYHAVVSSL